MSIKSFVQERFWYSKCSRKKRNMCVFQGYFIDEPIRVLYAFLRKSIRRNAFDTHCICRRRATAICLACNVRSEQYSHTEQDCIQHRHPIAFERTALTRTIWWENTRQHGVCFIEEDEYHFILFCCEGENRVWARILRPHVAFGSESLFWGNHISNL